jgi:hypothetical protein
MKKIIYISIIAILFASCSYNKRLNKWCKRCPSVESHDSTIVRTDTITYHDSIFTLQLIPLPLDTITLQADCPPSGVINIPLHTYDYDYVSVDVWVYNNTINVKPYLNRDTISILIKNARIEEYRYLYEKYKDYKSVTIVEKKVPSWAWWLLVILAALNVVQYFIYKLYIKK